MAQLNLRFLYIFCNDLVSMRYFYSQLLQLNEIYFAAGSDGGLGYKCDELQFTILPSSVPLPVVHEWHNQPGWPGGTLSGSSWSIACDSLPAFSATVSRLTAAEVLTFFERPQWLGYWSFPVKDPMGNTVELTLPTDSEPLNKVWSF